MSDSLKDKLPIGVHVADFSKLSIRERIEYFRDFFTEHPESDGIFLPQFGIDIRREDVLDFIQTYYEKTGERIEW